MPDVGTRRNTQQAWASPSPLSPTAGTPPPDPLTTRSAQTQIHSAGVVSGVSKPVCGTGPVAVGGVGGAGTRVVAGILQAAGYFLGADLNEAQDNLLFTLLFKWDGVHDAPQPVLQELYNVFRDRMTTGKRPNREARSRVKPLANTERPQHAVEWLRKRYRKLTSPMTSSADGGTWGWKEPNTHVVVDVLGALDPALRYIHVERNGFDMALSSNQNQPRLWGDWMGVHYDDTPRASLHYWRIAHERVDRIMADQLLGRSMTIRFDDLCLDPKSEIERMTAFLGCDAPIPELAALVKPPDTMGRRRAVGIDAFDLEDVEYVEARGFPFE